MSTAMVKAGENEMAQLTATDTESLVLYGDLNKLSAAGRILYYQKRCFDMGLDPLSKPFDLIVLNGKMVLYANKGCFEQLRNLRQISISIVSRERFDDLFVVTARATMPGGRCDEATGAANLGGLKGEAAANAIMKAETKAKRRVTLSICGMGMLDETEVMTVPGAVKVNMDAEGTVVGESTAVAGHTYLTAWKGKPLGDQDHIFEKGSHDYCPGCEKLWMGLTDDERDKYRKAYTDWIRLAVMPSPEPLVASQEPQGQRTELIPSKEPAAPFKEWLAEAAKAKEAIGEADYYRILKANVCNHANDAKQLKLQRKIRQEWKDCRAFQQAKKASSPADLQPGESLMSVGNFKTALAALIDKDSKKVFAIFKDNGYLSLQDIPPTEQGRLNLLESIEKALG